MHKHNWHIAVHRTALRKQFCEGAAKRKRSVLCHQAAGPQKCWQGENFAWQATACYSNGPQYLVSVAPVLELTVFRSQIPP